MFQVAPRSSAIASADCPERAKQRRYPASASNAVREPVTFASASWAAIRPAAAATPAWKCHSSVPAPNDSEVPPAIEAAIDSAERIGSTSRPRMRPTAAAAATGPNTAVARNGGGGWGGGGGDRARATPEHGGRAERRGGQCGERCRQRDAHLVAGGDRGEEGFPVDVAALGGGQGGG